MKTEGGCNESHALTQHSTFIGSALIELRSPNGSRFYITCRYVQSTDRRARGLRRIHRYMYGTTNVARPSDANGGGVAWMEALTICHDYINQAAYMYKPNMPKVEKAPTQRLFCAAMSKIVFRLLLGIVVGQDVRGRVAFVVENGGIVNVGYGGQINVGSSEPPFLSPETLPSMPPPSMPPSTPPPSMPPPLCDSTSPCCSTVTAPSSGVYNTTGGASVYCDMDRHGGGVLSACPLPTLRPCSQRHALKLQINHAASHPSWQVGRSLQSVTATPTRLHS